MTMTLYVAEQCGLAASELYKATKIISDVQHLDLSMCEDISLEVAVIKNAHEMLLNAAINLREKSKARMDMEE